MSKSSLTDNDQGPGGDQGSSKRKWGGEDVTSRIFNIIRDLLHVLKIDADRAEAGRGHGP